MSWRQILGVNNQNKLAYPHNTQNTHNTTTHGYSANTAYCAAKEQEDDSRLREAVADACGGLDISADNVLHALADADKAEWRRGHISPENLRAFAKSLEERMIMDEGIRPAHYNKQAECLHCGPVWLWVERKVLGCPWCWNRKAGKPIPRPVPIKCEDCANFKPTKHPYLGHCASDQPEPPAGLWKTDARCCSHFLLRPATPSQR